MRLTLRSFFVAATSFIFVQLAVAAQGPIVNLGYAIYQGYHDSVSGLNVWKGSEISIPKQFPACLLTGY
jgi:hypothetical protein